MAQATRIPSAILPSSSTASTVKYLPQIRHPNGDYFPETDLADTGRDSIINDIAGGQYERVVRVFAFDIQSGNAWDASEDIANYALWQAIDHHGECPDYLRDFVEEHLGCNYVRSCEVEAAA